MKSNFIFKRQKFYSEANNQLNAIQMNYKPESLTPGNFFHVFSRGNNGGTIFFDDSNYYHFLKLYQKYIVPVAETYAWCLLKNHFHALIYVRRLEEIHYDALRYTTVEFPRIVDSSRQFAHLFNSYTQAINKRYGRTGSLFENPFKRKMVPLQMCFHEMVYYIDNNPVLHGLVDSAAEYKWSSYNAILAGNTTILDSNSILSIFGGKTAFIDFHEQTQKLTKITKFIIE